MKYLLYLIFLFLRRFWVNWRFLQVFWSEKFFFFVFLWLFSLVLSGFIYFYTWVVEVFNFLVTLFYFSIEVLSVIFYIIYWSIRFFVFLLCFFISWFWIFIFYSLSVFFEVIGCVPLFIFDKSKAVIIFVYRVFFALFSDLWLIICVMSNRLNNGLVGSFIFFVEVWKLISKYRLIFIFLWKRKKLVFLRVLYCMVKFFFFCWTYKYIFFLRKMYIYYIWRHFPLKNLILAWFVEWVNSHWRIFKWIVRSVSLLSWFYEKFAVVYNILIYRRINWFLVSIQNILYWFNSRFNIVAFKTIYKWLGILHSKFIKYFSVWSFTYLGNKQVWKKNENFIFWRIYCFCFRGIIVLIVIIFGLFERFIRYIYAYWKLYFLTGLRISFYWRHFRDGVVMPVLNLDEVKPIVKMFLTKRERKYNRYLFFWLFFFIMYYVFIVLFVILRIVYVIIYCLWHWIRMFIVGLGRLVWKVGYYLGICHLVLVLKFVYWKLLAFVSGMIFKWCWVFWYFFFQFLFNFYYELVFGKFFWYKWFFNFEEKTKLIWVYLLFYLEFIFINLKSLVFYLQKIFIKGGLFGFRSWFKFKGSFYRFRIWLVYFNLYYYFLAWWRLYRRVDSVYNILIYRDFFTMWNFRSYILNNKGVLDYLKFFFWPQMDVYYRSAYVLQEILYLQVFRNLFRYRWFWADLRSYLWFFLNFVSFFFYFYFGSVHKVYLNSLFFRYLDIFRLFTIRRLVWMYVVEYVRINFYIKGSKMFIWYKQVKYLKGFNWGLLMKLRERFLLFFKKFFKLEDSKVFLKILQYFYSRGVEWFLGRLQKVFFSENIGLYYFFRLSTFLLDFRSRLDFLIEYKRLEYQILLDKESFLARRIFALNMVFEDLKKEDMRKRLKDLHEKEEICEDDMEILKEKEEILKEKEEILKISMGEKGPLKFKEWYYGGLRGVAGLHGALPKIMGNVVNKYGRRVSAGDPLDYMARYFVEGNISERIKNYILYFMFLVFVVMPWRLFDFICYWLFDILFVFIYIYIYLYFRILIFVTFLVLFGVVLAIMKILRRLVGLVVKFGKWVFKRLVSLWQN